jgi:hypothetical protein
MVIETGIKIVNPDNKPEVRSGIVLKKGEWISLKINPHHEFGQHLPYHYSPEAG